MIHVKEQHAWLSPEGRLFSVPFWGHDDWAEEYRERELNHSRRYFRGSARKWLMAKGWIILSSGQWHLIDQEITIRQWGSIHKWCIENNQPLPERQQEIDYFGSV